MNRLRMFFMRGKNLREALAREEAQTRELEHLRRVADMTLTLHMGRDDDTEQPITVLGPMTMEQLYYVLRYGQDGYMRFIVSKYGVKAAPRFVAVRPWITGEWINTPALIDLRLGEDT